MQNRIHPLFYLLLAAAVALAAWYYFTSKQEQRNHDKVEGHTEYREKVMDTDSLVSAVYRDYRRSQDSLIEEYKTLQNYYRGTYEQATKEEKAAIIAYHGKPSIPLADTLLKSKDKRIYALLGRDSVNQKVIATKDRIITSQDCLLLRKDKTIVALDSGYKRATRDLQKALKPKRWVLSTGVNYGVTGSGKVEPSVGVTLGYKLLQF